MTKSNDGLVSYLTALKHLRDTEREHKIDQPLQRQDDCPQPSELIEFALRTVAPEAAGREPASESTARFENHVTDCVYCRATLDSFQKWLADEPLLELPEEGEDPLAQWVMTDEPLASKPKGVLAGGRQEIMGAMTRPNLFDFATSELSQDAFLCWLLSWADRQYRDTDEALHNTAVALLHRLLALHRIDPPAECEILKIERQYRHTDILVLVNGDIALLIEDKINASDPSDKLRRYLDAVREDFPERKVAAIYLKTGDESSYMAAEDAGFARFTRGDLLDLLKQGKEQFGVTNDIYRDFHSRLLWIEESVNGFHNVPVQEWGSDRSRWTGFFVKLQELLADGNWRYVPTPSGGFMGFWWHWRGAKYLQLEEGKLCFKIQVRDKDEQQARWEEWHAAVMAESRNSGLTLRRPACRRNGTWMTVALLEGDYRQMDDRGCLDLHGTLALLRQAERLLDSAAARTQPPGS